MWLLLTVIFIFINIIYNIIFIYCSYVYVCKGKIHILVNQIEKIQIITTEEENIIVINRTHTEICNKLVEILQIQNNTLYNDICKIFNKYTDK